MSAERLPCGCTIDTVNDTFVIEPCSLSCPNYQYAMEESARQEKPVTYVTDPEIDP